MKIFVVEVDKKVANFIARGLKEAKGIDFLPFLEFRRRTNCFKEPLWLSNV